MDNQEVLLKNICSRYCAVNLLENIAATISNQAMKIIVYCIKLSASFARLLCALSNDNAWNCSTAIAMSKP